MKLSRLCVALIGASFLLPVGAFASNMNRKSLHLYESVTVEGKQLTPGDYKIEWSGAGPEVNVNILKGNETLVTASARVVPQAQSNEQDGYGLTAGKDGQQALSQVFFNGEKYDLNFGQGSQQTSSHASNSGGAN